jgi:uncharacterized repeat protein (TIGR01451 family)
MPTPSFTPSRHTFPAHVARRSAAGVLALAGTALLAAGCGTGQRSQTMVPTRHGDVELAVERSGGEEVRVGEEFTYNIELENTTDHPLHNVVVNETVNGDGFEMVSATPMPDRSVANGSPGGEAMRGETYGFNSASGRRAGGSTAGDPASGSTTSWEIGHIDPGESRIIHVRALADDTGDLHSCMTVDYDLSVCTTVEAVAPALTLTRSVGEAEYYACDPVEVTYEVTNTGSAATRPGVIEEPLPDGLQTAAGGRAVRLNVGAIEPGETVEKTVTLRASEALTYDNRATIRSGDMSVKSNGSPIRVLKPELELIVDGPREEYLNRSMSNRITVRNTSDYPARDVTITTDLPDDVSNLSLSSQRIERAGDTLLIGDLAAGESRTISLSFDPAEPGSLESSYTLAGYCVDEQTKQVATTVRGIPAVLIEVVDRVDPVTVSENTVYEINVKNQGSADGLDIRLTAPLPRGMEFVRVEGDRSAQVRGNVVVFDPVPQLSPGDEQSWELHLRAIEPGRTKFQVNMENAVTRSPVIEQEATTIID